MNGPPAGPTQVVLILGSPTPPGRFHSAVSWLLEYAGDQLDGVDVSLIDLRELGALLVDGRPPEAYGDAVAEAVARVTSANAVVLASPIYRASYTGLLKDFIDLLPVDALMGKPVAVVGMGSSKEHYLALENQLRPVLAWFGALVTPVAGYLRSDHFAEGKLGAEGEEELSTMLMYLVQLTKSLPAGDVGPVPLAARYMRPAPKA